LGDGDLLGEPEAAEAAGLEDRERLPEAALLAEPLLLLLLLRLLRDPPDLAGDFDFERERERERDERDPEPDRSLPLSLPLSASLLSFASSMSSFLLDD